MITKRMFIALDVSDIDKQNIANWRDSVLALPFKMIPQSNFHLTLAFLGQINEHQQHALEKNITLLMQNCSSQTFEQINNEKSEPHLTLNQVSLFKKPQVLHLMPTEQPHWLLTRVTQIKKILAELKIQIEDRPYQAHISLYRKAKFQHESALNTVMNVDVNYTLPLKTFSLYLSESTSQGVQYSRVFSWKI